MQNHDKLIAAGVPAAILFGARFIKTASLADPDKLNSLAAQGGVDTSILSMFDLDTISNLAEKYPNLYNAIVSDEGVDLILGLLSLKGIVSGNKKEGYGSIVSPNVQERQSKKHNRSRSKNNYVHRPLN